MFSSKVLYLALTFKFSIRVKLIFVCCVKGPPSFFCRGLSSFPDTTCWKKTIEWS